ncbi:MAG: hypothetical protein JWM96_894 [Alphaproteobacteria bacterium]|nr:hypothetical protein [Alphaproteobacteria bacterium]
MADKNKPQDDLSIEEILGSIRRIIAEDEDDAGQKTGAEGAPAATNDDEEDEVLELTNRIDPVDTQASAPLQDMEIIFQPSEVPDDLTEEPPETFTPATIPAEEPTPMVQPQPPQDQEQDDEDEDDYLSNDSLLSASTASATSAVMAKLARKAAVHEEGHEGMTIEAMVRQMIKPMLRDWLDANLPDMVQRMVEREIEKLTKRL